MIRSTSINAYNDIRSNGLLSRLRFQTYDILFHYGPMTANEIYFKAKELTNNNELRDTFHQRLSELKTLGVVIESGLRHCNITNREVVAWQVTDNLPKKFERKETKDEQIAFLKGKISILEERLKIYEHSAT